MTCEYSIELHCDVIGCRERINVFLLKDKPAKTAVNHFLYSEAEKKGWTNIEDHDYCPTHSKMIESNWCPYCKKMR